MSVFVLGGVGGAIYDSVMAELYKICHEEFGFEHNEERVCKAMFERTESKYVKNVEHFTFIFVMVMMPILLLTPKEMRNARFFLAVPFIFTLCTVPPATHPIIPTTTPINPCSS